MQELSSRPRGGLSPRRSRVPSQEVGSPEEQGLLQGALAGINNLANVAAPLLTAGLFAYFVSRGASSEFIGAPLFLCASLELAALLVARQAFRQPTQVPVSQHA